MNFFKMLYSNDAILNARKYSFAVIFIVFFLNVMILSAPLYNARATVDVDNVIETLALEEAFDDIYALDLPCKFTDTIVCTEDIPIQQVGDYKLVVLQEVPDDNYLLFAEDYIQIKYSEQSAYSGYYTYLEGMDLKATDNNYEKTETIMYGILSSSIVQDFYQIFVGQFLQYLLYFLAVSMLLNAANFKQKVKKISYGASVKITIVSMLGPAAFTSIIGFFYLPLAAVVFMSIYSLRMMFVYFKILNSKESLY